MHRPTIAAALLLGAAVPEPGVAQVAYTITGSIAPDLSAITARASIAVPRAALNGTATLQLGFASQGRTRLQVTRVLVDGTPAPAAWAADSLTATLPLASGAAPVTIAVEYRLSLDSTRHAQLGYYLFGSTGDSDEWYPTLPGLDPSHRKFMTFEVSLEAARDLAVLGSGPVGAQSAAVGSARSTMRAADVEGFALAFARGYTTVSVTRPSFRAVALAPVADTARFRRVAEHTARAAEWYRDTYGFFPVEQVGIVPGYRGARGGFPLPNVFMIHQGDLSEPFVRWITSHELAHYYWGLYVLDAKERLGWLMLALGIWTDQHYLATTRALPLEAGWRDPRHDDSIGDWAQAMVAGHDQRLDLPPEIADSLPYDYNSLVRHGKAATGVWLLSQRLGTDRFVALQKELLADYRHRVLSPEEFVGRLERAGVENAREFLRLWTRGDARIDYAVRLVRHDPALGGVWIQVQQTGTVPFPVTVEAVDSTGTSRTARLSGALPRDSVFLPMATTPVQVTLDPDGVMPSWSSDNTGMQRVFLRAIGRAGPAGPFIDLALAHLARDPDPDVASLVVERLFELGRWSEVIAVGERHPEIRACAWRVACEAALQMARAYARVERRREAQALLREIERPLADYGSATARRLATAIREIRP